MGENRMSESHVNESRTDDNRTGKKQPAQSDTYEHFQGFVASHYDLWYGPGRDATDFTFFKRHIVANGGPAAEIGCGTGRLLIPLLEDGLEVDGVDYSAEMLALCERKAAIAGVQPMLYRQPMQQLDLPRKYNTIFIPSNTFILLTDRADAMEALRRFYAHLESGGQLLLTLNVPKKYIDNPSDDWHFIALKTREDGANVVLAEHVSIDYWEQLKTTTYKYEVFRDGELEEEHRDMMKIRWFYRNEFELMLEKAGFGEIEIDDGYTPGFRQDKSFMVVSARKPRG